MNLETIIKLFKKADAAKLYYTDPVAAQRVAQMIADAENEACAKVCEDEWAALSAAEAIRARKEIK